MDEISAERVFMSSFVDRISAELVFNRCETVTDVAVSSYRTLISIGVEARSGSGKISILHVIWFLVCASGRKHGHSIGI